jgi:hypothetical protein
LFAVHTEQTKGAEPCQSGSDSEELDDEHDSEVVDLGCVRVMKDVLPQNAPGCPESKLYALVLTPTRELALQVHKHLAAAAAYTGIKVSSRQASHTETVLIVPSASM